MLDVMLPDIDGFEVLRRLREHTPNLPVLFLTVRDSAELLYRVGGFGVDGQTTIVDLCVSALRRKVDRDRPSIIYTILGPGHRIEVAS